MWIQPCRRLCARARGPSSLNQPSGLLLVCGDVLGADSCFAFDLFRAVGDFDQELRGGQTHLLAAPLPVFRLELFDGGGGDTRGRGGGGGCRGGGGGGRNDRGRI